MRKHAAFLGYLGLLPFLLLPMAIELNHLALYEGTHYFSQYSAIILSFLGGVLWYQGVVVKQSNFEAYIAMLPSIIGWISAAFLSPFYGVIVLAGSFILLLIYEFKILDMKPWYMRLRMALTSVVLGCHLIILWQIHQIG